MSEQFTVPRRTAKLQLHDEYEGAWMRVKIDVPLGVRFEMLRRHQAMPDNEERASGSDLIGAATDLFGFFCEHYLLEWNLQEEDGSALPANIDGFLELPPDLAAAVITATLQGGIEVPPPLVSASDNGNTPAAISILAGSSLEAPLPS
jgi:hypothetical protein